MTGDLDFMLPAPEPVGHSWHWATVLSASPLQVILDDDLPAGTPLDTEPINMVGHVLPGERVLIMLLGRRPILFGRTATARPLPFATASGEITVDPLSNGSTDSYSVTYPSGRFTQAPLVFVNTKGTVPRRVFGASGNSISGFTLRTGNYSGGNSGAQSVHWFAVQMEA